MRYTESREESAPLLRSVVARMGQHDAAFNPVTFAVWYEYVAGINPRLNAGLEERLARDGRLDTDTAYQLYEAYVADAGSPEAERISGDLQRVMRNLVEASSRTGDSAVAYGQNLSGLETALRATDGTAALGDTILQTLEGTRSMQVSVQSLRQAVAHGDEEIKALRAELDRTRIEVLTDPLTGIANRKGFDLALARLLALAPAGSKTHCLALLDIDHFKRVNDAHGHLAGDSVLGSIGEILKQSSADAKSECARYGGEEFAVLFRGVSIAEAVRAVDSICAATRAARVRDRRTGQTLPAVTLSVGLATWRPGQDATSLIAAADQALYRSKFAGRDRVTVV